MIARYDRTVLCTVGDLVEDVVVWLREPVNYGTDTTARIVRRRGGSAANVAAFAASAGGACRFVGQVGDDDTGERLLTSLRKDGVEPVVARGGRTGSIVVIVDPTGERTMLTDRGAATELERLPDGALDRVRRLHVPAYSLVATPLGSTTQRAIATAREQGVELSIDASSASLLSSFGRERFARLIDALRPDVFFCNRDEHRILELGDNEPMAGSAVTVIKAGGEPTIVVAEGRVTAVPVPPVGDITDTTGAGDAFAAGYLVALMHGATPVEAVHDAHRLAARVLTSPGAALT